MKLSEIVISSSFSVVLLLSAMACSQNKITPKPIVVVPPAVTQEMEVDLTGTIAVVGSSTVFPISEAVAEEFGKKHPGVRINVASTGTGAGGRVMCERGTVQVWDASRPATQKEIDQCSDNGIEVIELPVAFDALSVIVSPDNHWVSCLTVPELVKIFGPESEDIIVSWNQIRDEFPDSRIRIYGPTTSSGTFDYFTAAIMGESGSHRGDLDLATEEDPLIARGVSGTTGGIGYFGLAYLTQYQDMVKSVAIENPSTGECVAPSYETVESGQYLPLARPIFIYVRLDHLEQRPELEAFVEFYLDQAPFLVVDVGYVALSERIYDWGQSRISNRVGGSVFNTIVPGTPIEIVLEKIQ